MLGSPSGRAILARLINSVHESLELVDSDQFEWVQFIVKKYLPVFQQLWEALGSTDERCAFLPSPCCSLYKISISQEQLVLIRILDATHPSDLTPAFADLVSLFEKLVVKILSGSPSQA